MKQVIILYLEVRLLLVFGSVRINTNIILNYQIVKKAITWSG